MPFLIYSLREVISACTSEAVWLPDLSLLDPDLECQNKLINDHNTIRDCGQLSSVSGEYSAGSSISITITVTL